MLYLIEIVTGDNEEGGHSLGLMGLQQAGPLQGAVLKGEDIHS